MSSTTMDNLIARFDEVVARLRVIESHLGFANVVSFVESEAKSVETEVQEEVAEIKAKGVSLLQKVEHALGFGSGPSA